MANPLTIAVAGLGSRIACVIQNLVNASGGRVRIVGWADPEPLGRERLEKAGIATGQGFAAVEPMLAALRPDVLMVGSPNHLHVGFIEAGLAAGCRIFTEKPVAIDRAQTVRVARLAAGNGADAILVGLVLRSAPLFRAVMGVLGSGRLGRLASLETNEHLGYEHGGFLMRDWRRYRRYAGSYLLEKCCHDFDLYQGFTGARAAKVASFGGRDIFTPANAAIERRLDAEGKAPYHAWPTRWNSTPKVCDSDADTIDHQVAVVEYANGVRMSFHSNTHCAFHQRRWLLAGTQATLEADLGTSRLRIQDIHVQKQAEELPVAGLEHGHYGADEAMGRDLAATLLDGKPFPAHLRSALEAGLTCMAIDQAQRSGQVVDLAPWWAELDAAWPRALASAAR